MTFEWGWNIETVVFIIVGFIAFLAILQIGSHLMTDVPSKDEVRRIFRQELQRFWKEKEEGEQPKP